MPQIKTPMHKIFLTGIFALCLGVFITAQSYAQGASGARVIRDTEIEKTLKLWMAPLLESAGLGPNSVKLIIVESPQLNAFVAGGANIFVYTGLIERTKTPGELIGVLAHELGHITGGHLIATHRALERASYESILGTVLGLGAAIVAGSGKAAQAVVVGSQSLAGRRFLAHTRINESSADQAALKFMESSNINPTGLVSFFRTLESEELLPASQQSEYIRTHPLTRNRIDALETQVKASANAQKPFPDTWLQQHARMRAKLTAFISPGRVAWTYDDLDNSIPARYARTIAAYKDNHAEQAIKGVDDLISEEPDNPYFHELKGQMLVDFSRVKDALPSYKKAVELDPNAGLIRIAYAHALIESNQGEDHLRRAITELEQALKTEPRASRARRLLATAYGRLGYDVETKINLAEEAVLQRRYDYARLQAGEAYAKAEEGSRQWLQAKDILVHLETVKDEKK